MSLEIELHPVPHLKDLINAHYISSRQERGSTFTYPKTSLKIKNPFYFIQSKSYVDFCKGLYSSHDFGM